MELRLLLTDLAVLLGEDAASLDADQLRDKLEGFYGFLPDGTRVEVEDGAIVVVRWLDVAEPKKAEAKRLAAKAAQRARQGHPRKALDIWKAALALDPSLTDARRDLARALSELGESDDARNHLIEVLKLDPSDAWAFVVLANDYLSREGDIETAKRFFRRATELKPDDPWAMQGLANAFAKSGGEAEAEKLFDDILRKHPKLTPAHFNKAVLLFNSHRTSEAARCLHTMFEQAVPLEARDQQLLAEGRKLLTTIQARIASGKTNARETLIEQLEARVVQVSGFPVRIVAAQLEGSIGAVAKMAWRHRTDHHLVLVREENSDELFRQHCIMHQFHHILRESEAREIGANLNFVTDEDTFDASFGTLVNDAKRIGLDAISPVALRQCLHNLYGSLMGFVYNIPLDMFVEKRIAQDFPQVAEAQFLGLSRFAQDALDATTNAELRRQVPATLVRINDALNGAYAIFVDQLLLGRTAFSASYRSLPMFGVSQKLYAMWERANGTRKPGDEYKLVDAFAEELGVRDWYRWEKDIYPRGLGAQSSI